MCECKRAVRFCSDAEVKLVNCTNLLCHLCGRQSETGSFFQFQSSPLCLLLSWHLFHNSCPASLLALFFLSKNQPSSKVSEMQCQAHTVCAIWISIFVAKQQASKGFHYKSKSLPVMQLSRLWDVACCVGGTPPTPSKSVHVISRPNKELSVHCS